MKLIFTLLLAVCSFSFSQNDNNTGLIGKSEQLQFSNGSLIQRTVTIPEYAGQNYIPSQPSPGMFSSAGSMIRWSYTDAIAIASRNATSSNGQFEVTGWDLNVERISLFNNSSNTPVWEHPSHPNTNLNEVAVSADGSYIVNGSYHNIYVFNNSSSTPVFDFNLETQLPDTGIAGPVDITRDGNFIIATASRNDSSWIFGFNRTSTSWVWRYRVGQTNAGGASIQGVRMSGNDSTVIVNTYGGFYVFRTYTGQLIGQGLINPISNSGTQFPQGISGNGNLIATINYSGYLRVYQWNGSAYTFLWQHQEPPGSFVNWMTAVDITYDGSMISCGTLNFVTSSSFDGKVKLFRTTNNGTPSWTYTGAGDEVSCVSFSRDGKILAAATWGDLGNANNDLLVFKTSVPAPAPIFGVNSPGSFFWCSVSDNGSTVTASGKRIHARAFGNGGETYNVFIDTNDTPLGIENNSTPAAFELKQNYPNPFNPSTKISFSLPESGFVTLKVYDLLGREIRELTHGDFSNGIHSVDFSASDLSSGVYFYSIEVTSENGNLFKDVKKLTLLK